MEWFTSLGNAESEFSTQDECVWKDSMDECGTDIYGWADDRTRWEMFRNGNHRIETFVWCTESLGNNIGDLYGSSRAFEWFSMWKRYSSSCWRTFEGIFWIETTTSTIVRWRTTTRNRTGIRTRRGTRARTWTTTYSIDCSMEIDFTWWN